MSSARRRFMDRIGKMNVELMGLVLDGEAISDADERRRASEDCSQLVFAIEQTARELLRARQ